MKINWIEAYNRLFEIINANGDTTAPQYLSGPKFLKIVSQVDYSVPRSYLQFITERKTKDLSQSRRDYYNDVLNSLSEDQRIEAYLMIIENISHTDASGIAQLKALFGESIPTQEIRKKKVPESILSDELYIDILDSLYNFGRNLENKPSVYQGKGEEELRDLILTILETRYERTTSSGETFNKGGKTDILLKKDTGENLFIAECKIWHGKTEFDKAIYQLFDNYLTWRDSKAALILFVKNQKITSILSQIQSDISSHPYYLKENGKREQSSFSFLFRHKDDENCKIRLEVMLFHFPEFDSILKRLNTEYAKNDSLKWQGFNEIGIFDLEASEVTLGQKYLGKVEENGFVTIYNYQNEKVGRLFNHSGFSYDVFKELMIAFFSKENFDVVIESKIQRGNRTWFDLKLIKNDA